jgi:hypothetical protein
VAVKKSTTKRVVKKASKKAPAKKKAVAKKSVAKKSTAKKRVAKKAVAKKSVAKKSAVKKTAKRTTKKVAKKSSTKKSSATTFVVPPVPRGGVSASSRVNVTTTPIAAKSTSTPKPSVAPKQGTSKTVLGAVVVGIVLLAIIVWSQSGSKNDDGAMPTPPASAEATAEATTEPTAEVTETEETAAPVAAVEAPSKFVALKSAEGLTLRWIAPTATDGLTGYNVEIRANGKGDWNVIATVPADQLTQSVTKSDASGWTQFRVTSVYADGQTASATVFGIPGVFA